MTTIRLSVCRPVYLSAVLHTHLLNAQHVVAVDGFHVITLIPFQTLAGTS